MTIVWIDPNVRCRGNQTFTGLECVEGPLAIDDKVIAAWQETDVIFAATVTDLDEHPDKRLVWLAVDWAGGREVTP